MLQSTPPEKPKIFAVSKNDELTTTTKPTKMSPIFKQKLQMLILIGVIVLLVLGRGIWLLASTASYASQQETHIVELDQKSKAVYEESINAIVAAVNVPPDKSSSFNQFITKKLRELPARRSKSLHTWMVEEGIEPSMDSYEQLHVLISDSQLAVRVARGNFIRERMAYEERMNSYPEKAIGFIFGYPSSAYSKRKSAFDEEIEELLKS
jgi:hypothetical protein